MKFKIRHADKIVGFFIILSLVCLGFVVVMLGNTQRWPIFFDDVIYTTTLPTAIGLSSNMPVQYKGFTIGNVKGYKLEGDVVKVTFVIHEDYTHMVRYGSIVEMRAGPIPMLGNQFLFHPALRAGDLLAAETEIPARGSPEARRLIAEGSAAEPQLDDISFIMEQARSLLGTTTQLLDEFSAALIPGSYETKIGQIVSDTTQLLAEFNAALVPGSHETQIGQIVSDAKQLLAEFNAALIPGTDETIIGEIIGKLNTMLAALDPLLADANSLTSKLTESDGVLYRALDAEGEIFTSLTGMLSNLLDIIENMNTIVAYFPAQVPQLIALLPALRETLTTAEGMLTAVANSPMFKGAGQERPEPRTTGPRDIRF